MIMEIMRVAPTGNDFEEHEHTLSIDNIRVIATLKCNIAILICHWKQYQQK